MNHVYMCAFTRVIVYSKCDCLQGVLLTLGFVKQVTGGLSIRAGQVSFMVDASSAVLGPCEYEVLSGGPDCRISAPYAGLFCPAKQLAGKG